MTKIYGEKDDITFVHHSEGSPLFAEAGQPVLEIQFPGAGSEYITLGMAERIASSALRMHSIGTKFPPAPDATTEMAKPIPTDKLLQFFAYQHLRPDLQAISKPMHDIAVWIINYLPANPERTVALRKLLESKDCAVRAQLYKEPDSEHVATAGAPVRPSA